MKSLLKQRSVLKRLHWATWCAMLLTAVPLVLIMVPGERIETRDSPATSWEKSLQGLTYTALNSRSPSDFASTPLPIFDVEVELLEHGWPCAYLGRGVIQDTPLITDGWMAKTYEHIGWFYADSWPFFADARTFRWWALAIDLAVGVLILGMVGTVIEWRIRSGTRKWRFRILDAILITTVLALFLAPFAYHAHIQRLEGSSMLLAFREDGILAKVDYNGPVWLRKLVGNKFFLPSMLHIEAIQIDPSDDWRKEFAQLEKCPYLTEVTVEHWLPLGAIPILKQNRNLKHLGLPDLAVADLLREEQGDLHEPFQAEHIERLEPLELTSISLSGPGYQTAHVRQIAEYPAIQSIWLSNTLVSRDELELLRRDFPDVLFVDPNYHSGKPILWTVPRIDLPIKLPNTP